MRQVLVLIALLGTTCKAAEADGRAGSPPPVTLGAMYAANLVALKAARTENVELLQKIDALCVQVTAQATEKETPTEKTIRSGLLALLTEGGPLTGGRSLQVDRQLSIQKLFELVWYAAKDMEALNTGLWQRLNTQSSIGPIDKEASQLLKCLKIDLKKEQEG